MSTATFRFLRRALPLWMLAAAPLLADVTIRYQAEIKMSPLVPAQSREQTEKGLQNGGKYTLLMKNGKAISEMGRWNSIIDFAKEQMTLVDTENHAYSTMPASALTDKVASMIPALPESAQKVMASMKTHFESKKTGRAESILGIPAEEREMVLSIEMPQANMTMRMVMQVWTAKPWAAPHW
jgi:hypothetical protein